MPNIKGEIELDGLTMNQYRAAVMIASGKHIKDSIIIKELGIKKSELARWKQMPNFRFKVVQLFEEVTQREITTRTRKMHRILRPVYNEIKKRIASNELENMKFGDLIRVMTSIHLEIRQDYSMMAKLPIAREFSASKKEKEDEYEDDDFEVDGRKAMRAASEGYHEARMKAIENSKVVPIRKSE